MNRAASYVVLTFFTLLILVPFMLIALTAFKTQQELFAGIFTLPKAPTLENFVRAWTEGNFARYFLNSSIVVVPVVSASLLLSTP